MTKPTSTQQPSNMNLIQPRPACVMRYVAGVAALLAASIAAPAQTWQTVNDFQLVAGLDTLGSDIGFDSHGDLYAVGGASLSADDSEHATVLSLSRDHGGNWMTLPAFAEAGWTWAHYRAFAAAGDLLLLGGNGNLGGFVRESTDRGMTWTTVDHCDAGISDLAVHPLTGDVYAGGSSETAGGIIRRRPAGAMDFTTVHEAGPGDVGSVWAIAVHPDGAVIGAGNKVDAATRAMSWIVLRSDAGTAPWEIADTFQVAEWSGTSAGGCLVTSDGTVFVSGSAYNAQTRKTHWVVRRSTDGGITWGISDNFSLGGPGAQVFEIAQDAGGSLYVCGQAADKRGKLFWLVRKWGVVTTIVKGKPVTRWAWTTSDSYQLATGRAALPLGITVGPDGGVLVCGRAQDAAGIDHFIVRRLPAP